MSAGPIIFLPRACN
uniref:Uncharacterized protein n=1 Tax=Rhizophora mucronata TaxID=61149 RepID=A0A2P2MZ46_RHIMU